jgi:hypothetical protein
VRLHGLGLLLVVVLAATGEEAETEFGGLVWGILGGLVGGVGLGRMLGGIGLRRMLRRVEIIVVGGVGLRGVRVRWVELIGVGWIELVGVRGIELIGV